MMCRVSRTEGSEIRIDWKRRSRAGSFSICRLYSESVVAPMQRMLPRASAGFRILAASRPPGVLPVPMMVWISSMKSMTSSFSSASRMISLRRVSNSPRKFVPATTSARSMESIRFPMSDCGTSPRSMRFESASTSAVLPTPGSPIRSGLLLCLRVSTWMRRLSSCTRPMSGMPCSRASSAISSENCSIVDTSVSAVFPRKKGCSGNSIILLKSVDRPALRCDSIVECIFPSSIPQLLMMCLIEASSDSMSA